MLAHNLMDEDEAAFADDREPCPPEGFHSENRPLRDAIADNEPGMGADDDDYYSDEKKPAAPSSAVALARAAMDSTRHFVSMVKRPEWQIVALDVVARCVNILQMNRYARMLYLFLPRSASSRSSTYAEWDIWRPRAS